MSTGIIETSPTFEQQVIKAIEKNVERIVNEEAAAAAQRVKERVQRLAVDTAVVIGKHVSFRSFGEEMTFTIKNDWKTQELK